MQPHRMEQIRITSFQITLRTRVRGRSRRQVRADLKAHSDKLNYGRAVEHLHDGAGGANALEERVGDEDLVEAVEEGEEV
jgi:hypothetical protein